MKQAIALTSACAIFLMPVRSAVAADAALEPSPISADISSVSATTPPAVTNAAPAQLPIGVPLQNSSNGSSVPSTSPVTASVATDAPSATTMDVGSPDTVSASIASPNGIQTQVEVPSGAAQIVHSLPKDIQQELREQNLGTHTASPGTISSHGEQPITEEPEQCVSDTACGSRQALGFTMMAWGAALAALIGLIVWIGKPGHDPCCDSTSTCCN